MYLCVRGVDMTFLLDLGHFLTVQFTVAFILFFFSLFLWGRVRVAHLISFLCCVVVFSLSSSCVFNTQCFLCLWIVHSWLPLRLSLTFIYYVYICKYMNRKVIVQPAYSPHIFGCPTSCFFLYSASSGDEMELLILMKAMTITV